MNSLATVALGAFAIIFFCAALVFGLIVLKKYQSEKERLNQLAKNKAQNKTPTDETTL
jgi:preprotein translocase subunit SecG